MQSTRQNKYFKPLFRFVLLLAYSASTFSLSLFADRTPDSIPTRKITTNTKMTPIQKRDFFTFKKRPSSRNILSVDCICSIVKQKQFVSPGMKINAQIDAKID